MNWQQHMSRNIYDNNTELTFGTAAAAGDELTISISLNISKHSHKYNSSIQPNNLHMPRTHQFDPLLEDVSFVNALPA